MGEKDMEQEKAGMNWQKKFYVSWRGTLGVLRDKGSASNL